MPIFKRILISDIFADVKEAMEECFEGMNNCFITANFGKENIDYDLATKLNVFTNFSVMYCKHLEHRDEKDQAVRVCDILLEKNLPPQQRKSFDTIKARITKTVGSKEAKGGKGKDEAPQESETEKIASEVIRQLEMIAI